MEGDGFRAIEQSRKLGSSSSKSTSNIRVISGSPSRGVSEYNAAAHRCTTGIGGHFGGAVYRSGKSTHSTLIWRQPIRLSWRSFGQNCAVLIAGAMKNALDWMVVQGLCEESCSVVERFPENRSCPGVSERDHHANVGSRCRGGIIDHPAYN